MKIPISAITINERQRLDLGDLSDLYTMADPRIGQICPIVCDRHGNLIDGRRRLAKAQQLGWTEIEVHTREGDDDDYAKQIMELYADIGRKDRTWQERCLSFLKLYTMNPGLTFRQLATIMNCAVGNVSEVRNIAYELERSKAQTTDEDKELWACPNIFQATKLLINRQAKTLENEMNRRKTLVATVESSVPSIFEPHSEVARDARELPNIPVTTIKLYFNGDDSYDCKVFIALFDLIEALPKTAGYIYCASYQQFNELLEFYRQRKAARMMAFPVIWNQLSGKEFPGFPVMLSHRYFAFAYGSNWKYSLDRPIQSVINEPLDADGRFPTGLVQVLLDSLCMEGEKVYCDSSLIVQVAETGRIPVWHEEDNEKLEKQKEQLKEFYRKTFPNCEFI